MLGDELRRRRLPVVPILFAFLIFCATQSRSATISFNFQDQTNEFGPADNYALPAGYAGSSAVSVSGTLASQLIVTFNRLNVSNFGDIVPGYYNGNSFSTALYGDDSGPGSDTVSFNQAVTNVRFHISGYGTQTQYENLLVLASLGGQNVFTCKLTDFAPYNPDTSDPWQLIDIGSLSIDQLTLAAAGQTTLGFQDLPLGDLSVTTAPEPALAPIIVGTALMLLRRAPRRV